MIEIELELRSHYEDHDGYCSDADIEIREDEVRVRTRVPETHLKPGLKEWRVKPLLQSQLQVVVLVALVWDYLHEEYALELTKAKAKLHATTRDDICFGTGYCYRQPSTIKVNRILRAAPVSPLSCSARLDDKCLIAKQIPPHLRSYLARADYEVLGITSLSHSLRSAEESAELTMPADRPSSNTYQTLFQMLDAQREKTIVI